MLTALTKLKANAIGRLILVHVNQAMSYVVSKFWQVNREKVENKIQIQLQLTKRIVLVRDKGLR